MLSRKRRSAGLNLTIVSGGQTGADRAALDVALALGVPCGGWCPADRRAEDGLITAKYPLTPLPRGGYRQRTRKNVQDSDGTVILAFGALSGGSKATADDCRRYHKPCLVIDAAKSAPVDAAMKLAVFVLKHHIVKLNVAGPRASGQPRIYGYVREVLTRLLTGRGDDRAVSSRQEMRRRWFDLTSRAKWDERAAALVFRRLLRAYTRPSRHYHNLEHIRHCLRELDRVRTDALDASASTAVEAAIWFHDAVCNPRRTDNEQRSAELAATSLAAVGAGRSFIAGVTRCILATRHGAAKPATAEEKLMVDIDLSIFGGTSEEFDAYDAAIRREYAHVPEEEYCGGRAAVLQRFVDRPAIFHTRAFRDRYESIARDHLNRGTARILRRCAAAR
jgi:predicted metal-dependent HD superfamily phosphohydrolase